MCRRLSTPEYLSGSRNDGDDRLANDPAVLAVADDEHLAAAEEKGDSSLISTTVLT
jgi:hypothetical protein